MKITIRMPCAVCKKPGHNRKTCGEGATATGTGTGTGTRTRVRPAPRVPVFTYVDDEGSLNPIYKEDGLEDWMKPATVSNAVFDIAEAAIWEALRHADRGGGLTFEEVVAVVGSVTLAKSAPA